MKAQHHLLKRNLQIQLTDGSVYKIKSFAKMPLLKLNIDPKSHTLWKSNMENIANKNYVVNFMKKFFSKN